MAKMAKARKAKQQQLDPNAPQTILRNRKVRHLYEIVKTYEAGLALQGSEVKSLRSKALQWGDAHGRIDDGGELWLYGLHIDEYRQAGPFFNHAPGARRKLLLHRREIDQIAGMLQAKGLTVVPTHLYFKRGRAKCELAVVRGKKLHDKRKDLAKRSAQRDIDREMSRRLR